MHLVAEWFGNITKSGMDHLAFCGLAVFDD
jgi:hypothetical protein